MSQEKAAPEGAAFFVVGAVRRDDVRLEALGRTAILRPRYARGSAHVRALMPMTVVGLDGLLLPCYSTVVESRDIIARLKAFEPQLRARGVWHAALFGSFARGTAREDSDIDILIDLDPEADLDIYDYVGLKTYIGGLFAGRVDVVDRDALRPALKPPCDAVSVYAF